MDAWLERNRWFHIVIGYLGLMAFWIPIVTSKGGWLHKKAGSLFRYSGWIVVLSALLAVMLYLLRLIAQGEGPGASPESWSFLLFLGYLAIITGLALSHGMAVLKHKRDLSQLESPYRISLAWVGILSSLFLVVWALYWRPDNMVVLLALSPIGLFTGMGMLKLFKKHQPIPKPGSMNTSVPCSVRALLFTPPLPCLAPTKCSIIPYRDFGRWCHGLHPPLLGFQPRNCG